MVSEIRIPKIDMYEKKEINIYFNHELLKASKEFLRYSNTLVKTTFVISETSDRDNRDHVITLLNILVD
jgi:hypothetical protein